MEIVIESKPHVIVGLDPTISLQQSPQNAHPNNRKEAGGRQAEAPGLRFVSFV